jgi:pimeloyl-ACP methyl ester carboxylesterase
MGSSDTASDTVVLIHGLWVTPRSWEHWITHYAPLLFVSGADDHLMPPKVQRSNARHYRGDGTVTEVVEYPGPHLLPAHEGWEQIADHALDWAVRHAAGTPA